MLLSTEEDKHPPYPDHKPGAVCLLPTQRRCDHQPTRVIGPGLTTCSVSALILPFLVFCSPSQEEVVCFQALFTRTKLLLVCVCVWGGS